MSAPHPAPQDTPGSPTDLDDAARSAPAGTGPAGPAPATRIFT